MCSVALLGSNPRETTMWSKTVPWTTLTLAPARRASPSARSLGLTTQPHRRPTRTHETNLRGSWFPQNTSLIAESGLHLSSTSGPAISNPLDPEFLNAGGSEPMVREFEFRRLLLCRSANDRAVVVPLNPREGGKLDRREIFFAQFG